MRTEYREMLKRLMQRPNGQIALLLALVLSLLLTAGYGLSLHGRKQYAQAIAVQIKEQRQLSAQRQRVLLLQPSRREWQANLDLLKPPAEARQSLPHYLLAPLDAVSGRLLHWQPEQKTPVSAGQQQGAFRLQVSFHGLIQLLQTLLLQQPAPVAIEQLNVTKNQSIAPLLDVTLHLATYAGRVSQAQRERAASDIASPLLRDPFQADDNRPCGEPSDGETLTQLKGILGGAGRYTGWLIDARGAWLKAQAGGTIAEGNWHVEEVTDKQVRIRTRSAQCGERQQIFTLVRPD
ncbi:hypothetical protein LLS47_14250 [Rouxiella badensis]|uniref:hypothetical protein n=1 Tax=Rouxiella badensis TaxID=1646377 RepID=UPI001D135752|nr:hypothetical protein [Rouxiella badensis]MCC3720358.1 hypothetical protein [Rouxiella badensis]MCC3730196.1 hypothetical protein [Rouxiella badensis]MCC3734096.1 hypothetical protein [Rouxiella badensis]MCC3741640.1 hypothetical protein [Rouxiella badensis]MCC3759292.1 hypothetical protein [Rouxiella badensis]